MLKNNYELLLQEINLIPDKKEVNEILMNYIQITDDKDFITFLLQNNICVKEIWDYSVKYSYYDIIEMMCFSLKIQKISEDFFAKMIRDGRLDLIKFLDEKSLLPDISFTLVVFKELINTNNIELIELVWNESLASYLDADFDEEGNRPLHIAYKNKNHSLVKFLIQKGANESLMNADGDIPGNINCK